MSAARKNLRNVLVRRIGRGSVIAIVNVIVSGEEKGASAESGSATGNVTAIVSGIASVRRVVGRRHRSPGRRLILRSWRRRLGRFIWLKSLKRGWR